MKGICVYEGARGCVLCMGVSFGMNLRRLSWPSREQKRSRGSVVFFHRTRGALKCYAYYSRLLIPTVSCLADGNLWSDLLEWFVGFFCSNPYTSFAASLYHFLFLYSSSLSFLSVSSRSFLSTRPSSSSTSHIKHRRQNLNKCPATNRGQGIRPVHLACWIIRIPVVHIEGSLPVSPRPDSLLWLDRPSPPDVCRVVREIMLPRNEVNCDWRVSVMAR